jgi:hypothetical protein
MGMLRPLTFLLLSTSVLAAEKALPFWDLARWDAWSNGELVQATPQAVAAGAYTDPSSPYASVVLPSAWRDAASGDGADLVDQMESLHHSWPRRAKMASRGNLYRCLMADGG